MNNPNHPNLGRAHTSPGLNQQQSNMTDYYGADNDYMNEGGQDDALQMHPVDHLESMSKLPAHKRRFSATSFPHAYQSPTSGGNYQKQDEPVYDEYTGELIEDPRFHEWSEQLQKELSKMSQTVDSAAHKIKTGFKEDDYGYSDYNYNNYVPDHPQYDVNLLRTTLGLNYDGGIIWKKGEKKGGIKAIVSNTKWKQRYFKIELMGEVPKIYYFDSKAKCKDINKASGAMIITAQTTVIRPAGGKKKKNAKMRNKIDLIVNTTSDSSPETKRQFNLLCNTLDEAIAWEQAINHIVTKQEEHNQARLSGFGMTNQQGEGNAYDEDVDEDVEDDEYNREMLQEEKDKAQAIHARGNGLFDAIVGEEATFIIEAVDPLTQERLGEAEATMLQPNLYVTLMTVDPEDLEEEDEDEEEEDVEKNIQKRHDQELDMSKLGKDHLHYDLHPEYDPDEGHFVVRYTVSRVASYRLKILRDQHHIYGSPFHVVALPGSIYAKMCGATGNGIAFANPRNINTFTIEARDKMGNRKDTGGDQFFVQYEGAAIANGTKNEEGFILPIDNGDGTYTCKYNVDVEAARKMVRPFVTINVRIDDGSHFSQGSLDRFRVMSNMYEDGTGVDDEYGDHYDEYGNVIEKPQKTIERPAWHVHIKGSPFQIPIANSYDEAFPLGGAPGGLMNSPMLKNLRNNSPSKQTSYSETSPLRKAQFEAMYAAQQSNSNALLHAVGSRFEGSPKASYEVANGGDVNLARLAEGNNEFTNAAHAQREAALQEREMKLRQQEEMIRNQARQVEEQKARMNNQMNRIQRIGAEVNNAVGVGGSMNSPLGTPRMNNNQNNDSSNMISQTTMMSGGTDESGALFAKFAQPLHLVFKYYAGSSGGALTLEQYMRLGQDYDLYPTFLNKSELKKCFVEAARGHDTLVFTGFIDALRITAVVALSKKTFKSLYPTEASKVHVLLSLWGVGDPLKLEQLRSAHQQKAF